MVWQHEDARTLLTKYSHEKTYRLRESLEPGAEGSAALSEIDKIDATELTNEPDA